jgi:hypothetical protein
VLSYGLPNRTGGNATEFSCTYNWELVSKNGSSYLFMGVLLVYLGSSEAEWPHLQQLLKV